MRTAGSLAAFPADPRTRRAARCPDRARRGAHPTARRSAVTPPPSDARPRGQGPGRRHRRRRGRRPRDPRALGRQAPAGDRPPVVDCASPPIVQAGGSREVSPGGSVSPVSDLRRAGGRADPAHAGPDHHRRRHRQLVRAHRRLVLPAHRQGRGRAIHVRSARRAGDHGVRARDRARRPGRRDDDPRQLRHRPPPLHRADLDQRHHLSRHRGDREVRQGRRSPGW